MASDRVLGLVVVLVALAFIASALQLQSSFMSDPVGSKTFPILIGAVAVLCGGVMIFRPDEEPEWPEFRTLISLALSVAVMVAYAYTLKPLGFLLPTAVTAAILSYQISRRPGFAIVAGVGLSLGLFALFRYALGLGLVAFSKGMTG